MAEFDRYMNTHESIPDDMSTVEWWGVCIIFIASNSLLILSYQLNMLRYPTWASLARDYLPIMASSVSSERAFSSAGITISKRRNRLKGDIVEALQCLKLLYRNDLIFREVITAVEEELERENDPLLDEGSIDDADLEKEFSWDQLLIDEDDDGGN